MKIKDERIFNEHTIITANAYNVLIIGIMLVTFYRMFILNQIIYEYQDYIFVMFAAMLYRLFMNIKKGLYHNYTKASKSLRFKIAASLSPAIAVVLSQFLTGQSYGGLLNSFAIGLLVAVFIFTVISIANKVSSQQAEKALSDNLESGDNDE